MGCISELRTTMCVAMAAGVMVVAAFAQDSAVSKTDAKRRGRLPAYYSKVVSEEQRSQIYEIQEGYAAQIEKVRMQLDELYEQRESEIASVLSPEQLKEIAAMAAAARARRAAGESEPTTQEAEATPAAGTGVQPAPDAPPAKASPKRSGAATPKQPAPK